MSETGALQRVRGFKGWSLLRATVPEIERTATPPAGRAEIAALLAILALAFALRLLLALYFPNVHHPDELFQYLEQGHRLAFGYGVVPWEFRDGTRSWLLPGLLGGMMRLTSMLGGGAAAYLAVIAGVLSALSVSIVLVAWLWARRLAGSAAALLAAAITATWFELVYFGSKPLTESVASATLFAAAYLLWSATRSTRAALFAGGLLLGLTFVVRPHLTPALIFVAMAGCVRGSVESWLICGIGGTLVVGAAGVLDWMTWGFPFHSFWANFQTNLLHDKASQYGISAWYAYASQYALAWSGIIVPCAILALYGARRAPLLLIVPLLIVISHSLIAHKEYRFVFPAVPFVLLAAALGTADVTDAMRRAWPALGRRVIVAAAMLCWTMISAVLSVGGHFRPNLTASAPGLAALAELRDRPPACGVGLISVHWHASGGYTYLHQDVPLYLAHRPRDLAELWNAFDVALAQTDAPLEVLGYRREHCYSEAVCLFRRTGACMPQPDRAINEELRRRNQ